ncbi:hypothetical protein BMF94_4094 [Rhodotorula taiwanensis]|uniref:DUF202 domain-containing protein n=1 Tax=Rhodotorula taiwanensis TaxID=741276 RepID=A0A2S5B7V1_9BASI|nr:hypothetical protein BMF94_4094 [Rhodotorula taiwanensis]
MVGHTNPLHLGHRKETAGPRTYRGHRRASWILEDQDALIELRARSRTFDGAYVRTALGHLYYSLIVLKIFSPEFAKIGLIYVIMSCLLLLIAQVRRRRSDHDFSDKYITEDPLSLPGVKASERLWGIRPFRTSGDTVILIGLVCSALYITTFILIMRL